MLRARVSEIGAKVVVARPKDKVQILIARAHALNAGGGRRGGVSSHFDAESSKKFNAKIITFYLLLLSHANLDNNSHTCFFSFREQNTFYVMCMGGTFCSQRNQSNDDEARIQHNAPRSFSNLHSRIDANKFFSTVTKFFNKNLNIFVFLSI
jgi:hypothetical protein